MQQLLNGEGPALALLPRPDAGWSRCTHARALLYEYDFTRIPSPWARRVPGAVLVGEAGPSGAPPARAEQWWARTEAPSTYLAPFALDDARVGAYLASRGLPARTRARAAPREAPPPLWPRALSGLRLGTPLALSGGVRARGVRGCAAVGLRAAAQFAIALVVRLDGAISALSRGPV